MSYHRLDYLSLPCIDCFYSAGWTFLTDPVQPLESPCSNKFPTYFAPDVAHRSNVPLPATQAPLRSHHIQQEKNIISVQVNHTVRVQSWLYAIRGTSGGELVEGILRGFQQRRTYPAQQSQQSSKAPLLQAFGEFQAIHQHWLIKHTELLQPSELAYN